MKQASRFLPGVTLRFLASAFFCLIALSATVHFTEVVEASNPESGSQALAAPALYIFLPLLLVSGGVFAATRFHFLSRAEGLCLLYMLLIAAPLMSRGFWERFPGAIATIPRTADLERYDAYPELFWPHGPNLMRGAFGEEKAADLAREGDVEWNELEYNEGKKEVIPEIFNEEPGQESWFRVSLPVENAEGGLALPLGEPLMFTVGVLVEKLGSDARYYCRVYYDEEAEFAEEAFNSTAKGKKTFVQRRGALRQGIYGLRFAPKAQHTVHLQFGLVGEGAVAFFDPRLLDVSALEYAYEGKTAIAQSEYDKLDERERTGLIPVPDNMWSWAGIKHLVAGRVPWREWMAPLAAWGGYAVLLLTACLALGVLMRKQWIDSERYPLPLARIPLALLGETERAEHHALAPIWMNRIMWFGFAASFFWCVMKGWAALNPNVPNMQVNVLLKPYFNDPGWGKTFDGVAFSISATFLGLAIFMELNVMASLLIGYWLFRAQHWIGTSNGWAIDTFYPYATTQEVSSFAVYGLLILFFARKYLWRTFLSAVKGDHEACRDELFSYRTAFALLLLCFAGVWGWALWLKIPPASMLIFFGFLTLTGLVATKIRAECGAPFGMYYPWQAMVFAELAGGMFFFGAEGLIFATLASLFLLPFALFLIPGAQFELLELGRRFRVRPSHLLVVFFLATFGGLFIGGWAYLSTAYGIGGQNYGNQDALMERRDYFRFYSTEESKANEALFATAEEKAAAQHHGLNPTVWAAIFSASVAAILAVLRQLFAGFWFHPVGFILGPSQMMGRVWGSVLAAWAIRSIVLRLGGAATVREKLMPFFIGVFLAAISAQLLFALINMYYYFFLPGELRVGGLGGLL